METGGFFKGLFDFDFRTLVSLKFIKVIYIVGMVLIGIAAVGLLVANVARGGAGVFIGIVVVPIVALLYLSFLRVWLEVIVVLFRIGDNTSKTVELLGGQAASPEGGPGA